MNVCISRPLKQELAWAIDIWLRVISNTMLFKTVIPSRFILNTILYVLLCGP